MGRLILAALNLLFNLRFAEKLHYVYIHTYIYIYIYIMRVYICIYLDSNFHCKYHFRSFVYFLLVHFLKMNAQIGKWKF